MSPNRTKAWLNGAGLLALYAILVDRFPVGLLFSDTILTGGDAASWYQSALHLRDTLLPNGRLFGWDQNHYFGYPHFQYYFVPPFLLAVVLSAVVPLTIALKLVTVLGVAATPLAVYWALRRMDYTHPTPLAGAWLSLVFLFHERFAMFGGNLASTLAGEFAYSIAFALLILFMGSLYRGMTQRRHLVLNSGLLAAIGLTHAFVFLPAAAMPLYFLWRRETFSARLRYVLVLYGLAFQFMAFWVLPMLAQMDYTTPISMIWRFPDGNNLLYALHYEVLLLAGLCALLSLDPRLRGPGHGLFLFMIGVSAVLYFAATPLRIADIRFFPPLLFFSLMFVVDTAGALAGQFTGVPRRRAVQASLTALALIAGAATLYSPQLRTPEWFAWNYSGFEAKPAFSAGGAMEQLVDALAGEPRDGRIAWEHFQYNGDFGSDRVFESLPLFTHRYTTEGVHYASALLSKIVSVMHSEYSRSTGAPENMIFSHPDTARLPARFRLFNITDLISATPQMQAALAASPAFEHTLDAGRYQVFSLRGYEPHFVATPRFAPLLADTTEANWKRRFHAWFRRGDNLERLLVAGHLPSTPTMERLTRVHLDDFGIVDGLPPPQSVPRATITHERIDHLRMAFQTDRPGQPHLIKVAYSPNWRSVNGEPLHLVSPGLMLLYPQTEQVTLVYTRPASERLGWLLSLSGLVLAGGMLAGRWRPMDWLGRLPWLPAMEQVLARRRWSVVTMAGAAAMAAMAWSYAAKQQVYGDYQAGGRLAQNGQFEAAALRYGLAASLDHIARLDNGDVPNALYALAGVYRRLGQDNQAREAYQRLLHYYPRWVYISDVYRQLGEIALAQGEEQKAAEYLQTCADIERYAAGRPRCRERLNEMGRSS